MITLMRRTILTLAALCLVGNFAFAQDDNTPPLVFNVENSAAANPDPVFPSVEEAVYCEPLPDPFLFSDGSGRAMEYKDWAKRRGEIAREIQHYEIGDKPAVSLDDIQASMDGNVLTVITTVNGKTLTQTATINYPSGGEAPYPLMIGASNISLAGSFFSSRNIATMNFSESQVNGYSQFGGSAGRAFEELYPDCAGVNGAYSEWAWGFSRLLDGLQKLGPEVTKIDMAHIGVTGCSYAGKMALFCGAFDERVALTIAQEPGGGGANAWRVTWVHNRDYPKDDAWEGHNNTDYNWFMKSMRDNYKENKIFRLPYDHHELVALCCPRAILVLGNPSQKWLGDGSGRISCIAARKVWEQYGIADRMGYSFDDSHQHCQLPAIQNPDVEAFLDRYMLGLDVNTDVQVARPPLAYNPKSGGDASEILDPEIWTSWWGTTDVPPSLPNNKPDPVKIWASPMDMVGTSTDWVVEDDADAPLGQCVSAAVANDACPTDAAQGLTFNFSLAAKTDCYVYAFVKCANSSSDAVYMSFDDNPAVLSNGARSPSWGWKSLYSLMKSADKTSFVKSLEAGEHQLHIYSSEPNYKIGALCISNNDALSSFKGEIENVDIGEALGIETVQVANHAQHFNVAGQKVSPQTKGLHIIREAMSNGSVRTKKVMVK